MFENLLQKITNKQKVFILKILIHLSALIPLLMTYYLAFNDGLGADPVEAIIHFTGIGALNLLFITLLVSPLAKRFKLAFIIQTRRLLGIYAFSYALCHLLNFLFFEVQFNFSLFFSEIIDRPYITVGLSAFILLIALTVTSLMSIRRKMGKRWQTLHNMSYLVIVLVVIHFYWSVKSEIIEPLIYGVVAISLLLLRRQKIVKWFKS